MTSPVHGDPESSRHALPAEPGAPEDDDTLIDMLRTRAWDPALRFDTAPVPRSWIEEHFGPEHLERMRSQTVGSSGNGMIVLKSQAEEVAAYFADAPRGPLFPPVTPPEVETAEAIIGRPLPALLRRIYTEVGDGGFGPDSGLASLTDGRRAPGDLIDWPCSITRHERDCAAGLPGSWLYLASGGCTMQWHLSLLAAGNPVLLHDTDGWVPSWGEGPHDGLRYAAASLRQWLWTWATGGDVWTEALSLP
ncbi:SMI1/KNR4 family protein [Streptomyces sp. NPDC004435]|uniref:SMI1/KNR4 family protein n=1 Tax=Streptomyces sp. NPDC004435 TaxID=3364701 RepID=UPI00367977D9